MTMTERIDEAFNSKVATKVVLTCIGGAVAFLGYLLWNGWSKIDETSISQRLMAQQVNGLVSTVDDLKNKLEASSSNRYDSNAAATQNAAMVDLINTMNTNLTAMIGKALEQNRVQDEQLRTLGEFKARIEERLQMQKSP